MSEIIAQPSRLKNLQQHISAGTWLITLALSLRGIFAFYGMKDKGSVEQILVFITDPLVHLFRFEQIESIGILFAAVSLLLISNIVQVGIKLVDLRMARAHKVVFRHNALRSK